MTPRQRDVMALIVKSPWWVVVGLVAGGSWWGAGIQAEVQQVREQVAPLHAIDRQLDSLRIEQRHISETVEEIRHLMVRRVRGEQWTPFGGATQ